MRIQLLTLRYSLGLGVIDDRPLAEFVRDKCLLSVREHFFVHDGVPHLACLVTYQDGSVQPVECSAPAGGAKLGKRRRSPREDLTDDEQPFFETLREWRSVTSRKEGVPPFVILTDRQLVDLVRARPDSKNGLLQIDGIGPAKIKRYGDELLARLHGSEPDPSNVATSASANGSSQ